MNNLNLFFKRLVPSNKKAWSVFAGCLLTASVFWLVLTFSRNFETVLNFNVKYTSQPADKIVVNEPSETLKLKVKGRGFDLFRYTIFDKQEEIAFDLSDFRGSQKGSLTRYYLPLNDKTPVWMSDKKWDFKILSYSDDTLFLDFDQLTAKKVRIVPVYRLGIDTTNYVVRGVDITPDSIEITGGKSQLAAINFVKTQVFILKELKRQITAKLEMPDNLAQQSMDSVSIKVNFEKIKQHKMTVPIICPSCPNDLNVKLFPSSAELLFSCTDRQLMKLSSNDFKVEVKYDEIQEGLEKLYINLMSFPADVTNLKVSPAKADYLIRE